jgi:hypothetical protein
MKLVNTPKETVSVKVSGNPSKFLAAELVREIRGCVSIPHASQQEEIFEVCARCSREQLVAALTERGFNVLEA